MKDKKNEMKRLFVPKKNFEEKKVDFIDVLKMFAPGTAIRSALDDLLKAEMGALIVIDNGKISSIFQKGFGIHARFTPQKLMELAKMDGAIILSKNLKKILFANAFLFPNQEISTKETGTRHKAAERTARQTGAIVVAISERKKKILIYQGDKKHELKEGSEILRRAAETLQVLEKQTENFNEVINNLNLLELRRIVTINDVCLVIQKFEAIKRISDIVKKYLIELGREGAIVSMRLRDLTRGMDKEEELLLEDYFGEDFSSTKNILEKMDFDFLLEPSNVSRMLFEELHDRQISPKGFRILRKTSISEKQINDLISLFGSLDKILLASDEELLDVFQSEGMLAFFREEIYSLREKLSFGRRI